VKVLIVSGIWPPDVGGPASHGPELGRFLAESGHEVRAVTAVGGRGAEPPGFPVRALSRETLMPLRLTTAAIAVASDARGHDVIYAAGGLYTRSLIASRLWSVPLVVKLTNDPAYERARARGAFTGSLEDFQESHSGGLVRLLKRQRDLTMRRASRIIIPSRYLAKIAAGWGLPEERISVIPNPAPRAAPLASREELRRRLGMDSPTFVFAGRFVIQKNLPLALAALQHADGARLVLIGEGPEEDAVADEIARRDLSDRVSMKGPMARATAVEWVRAADAAVLPSDWENFPHAVVEALAVGTPVIATAVGGVPEIIDNGVNGILVPPGDARALGEAMGSVAADPDRTGRLREGARRAAGRYSPERVYAAVEAELHHAIASSTRSRTASA